MILPPLYAIVDFALFSAKSDPVSAIAGYAESLLSAGVTLVQFRDKSEPAHSRRFLSCARELRRITAGKATLIINDRLDFCLASSADGVHLGQDDLSPVAARKIFDSIQSHPLRPPEASSHLEQAGPQRVGHPHPEQSRPQKIELPDSGAGEKAENRLLIGYSTHNVDQVREACLLPIDYIAIGPVFATASKANPDPVTGLEGVRAARQATDKPLVAIGGITRKNCREVMEAGADSVAVISDLFESPVKAVADFLGILR
jgi:thiamine-phosphate pyrophosphorylase